MAADENDESQFTGEIWTDPLTGNPYFQLAHNPNRWVTADGEHVRYVYLHGSQEFRNRNGSLHRLGGPAVINRDGSEEWWVNGAKLDFGSLDKFDMADDFQ